MTLKVLSLNIWNRSGPWEARLGRIREWIDRLDPDLVGLQEVLRGPGFDQLEGMFGDRGFHLDFEKAIDFWEEPSLGFGNAIASRWPILERDAIRLPSGDDPERRCALSVTADAPFGAVSLTTTHLNWRLHHGYIRELQVAAVCDHARKRRPRGGFPPIVCGDFNAEPDSSEIRYVKGHQVLEGRSVHFRDAWAEAGTGSDGITWSNRNAFAEPWLEPERRIDYVFVGPPVHPTGLGQVQSCRVVCDDAVDGVWPTDHLGVYAELRTEPLPAPPIPAR